MNKDRIDEILMRAHPAKTAMDFAVKAHGNQMYGEKPYIFHLLHVDQVLCRFGYFHDINLREAGFLHDVQEDTDVTNEEIKDVFGSYVARIVDAVSDRVGESKKDVFKKRTRHLDAAIILKMADRIANVEACLAENQKKHLDKYANEQYLFSKVLKAYEVNEDMYIYLNNLLALYQKLKESPDIDFHKRNLSNKEN